jgi:hypothetical protein
MSRQPDKEYHLELYDKIWRTKGSRFIAYQRLLKMDKLSTYSIGLLSTYLILINLLIPLKIIKTTDLNDSLIPFLTVALSIIILIFSQIEHSNNYRFNAAKFHDCATELGKVLNDLHMLIKYENLNADKLRTISDQYSEILNGYDNHLSIDHEYHKAMNYKYFKMSSFESLIIRSYIKLSYSYLYYIVIVVPPIVFYIIIKNGLNQ